MVHRTNTKTQMFPSSNVTNKNGTPWNTVIPKLRVPAICTTMGQRFACMGAVTVAWRRGAKGRAYAGQPLCNGCGMYASRHPRLSEVSTLSAVLLCMMVLDIC